MVDPETAEAAVEWGGGGGMEGENKAEVKDAKLETETGIGI